MTVHASLALSIIGSLWRVYLFAEWIPLTSVSMTDHNSSLSHTEIEDSQSGSKQHLHHGHQ